MSTDGVTLVVPGPLRFFLPARRRGAEQVLPVDGTSTVGHLLTSLGVPRTEVGGLRTEVGGLRTEAGGLRAGGVPVPLSYRPAPGDRIEVVAVRRPQAGPTSPPRFVLDVHLGTLARRLRLLGLDTTYARDADDDALLETSLRERRILLTRDRGLLHRRALRWGAHVDHQVPDEQLREVLERFAPPLAPWTRCPACNGVLRAVAKHEIESALPPGTRRSYETFQHCAACGKVYWHGAHGTRLRRIVDAATG